MGTADRRPDPRPLVEGSGILGFPCFKSMILVDRIKYGPLILEAV